MAFISDAPHSEKKEAFWRKKENPLWQAMISLPVSYTSTNKGDGSIRALK